MVLFSTPVYAKYLTLYKINPKCTWLITDQTEI